MARRGYPPEFRFQRVRFSVTIRDCSGRPMVGATGIEPATWRFEPTRHSRSIHVTVIRPCDRNTQEAEAEWQAQNSDTSRWVRDFA